MSAARIIDIPRAATNFRFFAEAIISPKLDRVNYQGNLASVATRTPIGNILELRVGNCYSIIYNNLYFCDKPRPDGLVG